MAMDTFKTGVARELIYYSRGELRLGSSLSCRVCGGADALLRIWNEADLAGHCKSHPRGVVPGTIPRGRHPVFNLRSFHHVN